MSKGYIIKFIVNPTTWTVRKVKTSDGPYLALCVPWDSGLVGFVRYTEECLGLERDPEALLEFYNRARKEPSLPDGVTVQGQFTLPELAGQEG